MANDLIPLDQPIPAKEITFDELPELLPQQRLMLNYILEGNNYTQSYRLAGYSSKEHAGKAAWHMISHHPLKAWLEYYSKAIAQQITPEWKASKLRQIIENSLQPTFEGEHISTYNPEIAIKAIAELNKMAGDYATTATQVNHVHASIEDIRNARLDYKKDK